MDRVIVPIITPLDEAYSVDYYCVPKVVNRLYKAGIRSIFISSTTGELDRLLMEEVMGILEHLMDFPSDLKIYVGLKSDNAFQLGLDIHHVLGWFGSRVKGFIIPPPSYHKYTDEELRQFYYLVARELGETDAQLIIYQIPSLTGNLLNPESYVELAHRCTNLVGIKLTLNDAEYLIKTLIYLEKENIDLKVYVGNDALIPLNLIYGGYGVIPGFGNVYPKMYLKMIELFENGDIDGFLELHKKLMNRIMRVTEIYREYRVPKILKRLLMDKIECLSDRMKPPMLF